MYEKKIKETERLRQRNTRQSRTETELYVWTQLAKAERGQWC